MHLTMDALRILVVLALGGKTWAAGNVYDSPSSPAAIQIDGDESDKAPFIAVYVDDCDVDYSVNAEGRSLGTADAVNSVKVIIEVGVLGAYKTVEGDEHAAEGVTGIGATDPGMELQIGLISRQALDVLQGVGDSYPWSELWRHFTGAKIKRVEVRRGGPSNEGAKPAARYASRVTIIEVETLAEPVRGSDLNDYPVWKKFIDALATSDDYGGAALLMRQHITGTGSGLSEAYKAQKMLGVSEPTIDLIGIGPRAGVALNSAPPASDFESISDDTPTRETIAPVSADPWPPGEYMPDVE